MIAQSSIKDTNEPFKVELIESIPGNEPIRMYWHGEWQDLCRGPHLNIQVRFPPMVQIDACCGRLLARGQFARTIAADLWCGVFEQRTAKGASDHAGRGRKTGPPQVGREMDLFHMQEEAPGQIFGIQMDGRFTHASGLHAPPTGTRRVCRGEHPQVVDRKLWEASGHWDKYQENMFIVEVDEEHAREKAINALKPMNCPCHVQVYNQGLKSYRDLPLRMAEFGSCNRYEPSGHCTGSCVCADLPKMTRIFSVAKIRSRRKPRSSSNFCQTSIVIWALKTFQSNFLIAQNNAQAATKFGINRKTPCAARQKPQDMILN